MSRDRAKISSSSSRNGSARLAMGRALVSDRDQTTVYLLLQLRKANRTIVRLRACALAARDGSEEELRAALAALRAEDLGS